MLGRRDESNPVLSRQLQQSRHKSFATHEVLSCRLPESRHYDCVGHVLPSDEFSPCRCAGQASDRRTGACGRVQVLDEYDILDTKISVV